MTAFILLAYLAADIGASVGWRAEDSQEAKRRISTVFVMSFFSAASVSIIYSQVPALDGPILSGVWVFTLIFLVCLSWTLYHEVRTNTRSEEQVKLSVVEHIDKELQARLEPLTGAVNGMQTTLSELTTKFAALSQEMDELAPYDDSLADSIQAQTRAMEAVNKRADQREAQYSEVITQYYKWHKQRDEAIKSFDLLIDRAQDMLERFGMFSDQLDELSDSFGRGGSESQAGSSPKELNTNQVTQSQMPQGGAPPSPSSGKLTKEAGIANRDKGNKAQLKFSEETLHGAGKLHDNSLKEGTPDFVFYAPGTRTARGVGAFKALTLKEDGTRQRWIPRRKVLAELRLAQRYAVPMILFVQNLTNGRIWAKVMPVGELREFNGLTTPLDLVENEPRSERVCRETMEMALQLL